MQFSVQDTGLSPGSGVTGWQPGTTTTTHAATQTQERGRGSINRKSKALTSCMEREQRQLNSDVYQLRKDKSRELEKIKCWMQNFKNILVKEILRPTHSLKVCLSFKASKKYFSKIYSKLKREHFNWNQWFKKYKEHAMTVLFLFIMYFLLVKFD